MLEQQRTNGRVSMGGDYWFSPCRAWLMADLLILVRLLALLARLLLLLILLLLILLLLRCKMFQSTAI